MRPSGSVIAAIRGSFRDRVRSLPRFARQCRVPRLFALAGMLPAGAPRRSRGALTRTRVRGVFSQAPLFEPVSLSCFRSSVSPPSFSRSILSSGRPFPPWVLVRRVPHFAGTMSVSDFSSPVPLRFVVLRLRGTLCARCLRVPCGSCMHARDSCRPRTFTGVRVSVVHERRRDLPGSCGAFVNVPCSLRPRWSLYTHDPRVFRCSLPQMQRRRPPQFVLSGLNHTARPLAVYASPPCSRTLDARLASGW